MSNTENDTSDGAATAPAIIPNITSRRLYTIIAGLWLALFMSALDTTIITTALIRISSDFDALDRASWLVTTYLLTYNSFLMVTAKLSDVWGLKIVLLVCLSIFLVFSMACAGAQSMIQLIVFRAFQGIGGSGLYSLVFVAVTKLVTPDKLGFYSGIVSSVFALANLLGPVLGGVISDHTTWRWIFWINGPIVGSAFAILFFSMPTVQYTTSNKDKIRTFDILGAVLSVCWPIPLLFALQEGGSKYEWNDAIIIGTLTAGLVALILFAVYETWITYRTSKEAIFPIRFIRNPTMALLLLSMFLLGMPFYVAVIQLPQRFQAANDTSAQRAGILLLPVTLLTPVGAMLAGAVMGKKLAAEYILIIGTAIVSIGIGLISSIPVSAHFWPGTYAYEVITGFGLGFASGPYYFMLYSSVDEKDAAVGTGALNMWRTLGGAVAVAICSALHNSALRSKLPRILTAEQIAMVAGSSASISQLPIGVQKQLREIFGRSYNRQFQVMIGFACLNFLVAVALALVRKRKGIFGVIPERKIENEFMKKEGGGATEEVKVSEAEAKTETGTPAKNSSG